DYKYDYLVTWDFESMLKQINEVKGEKLKFVTKHIPVSASIATNVPGFEEEYFILSTKPEEITCFMFEYLDKIVEKSTVLMMDKMKPLLEKISEHYNETERDNLSSKVK